jgi:catechol 2,3-dioxygenase-like lactoylglutathione lyase family enzyme
MSTVSVRYIVDNVEAAVAFYTTHLGVERVRLGCRPDRPAPPANRVADTKGIGDQHVGRSIDLNVWMHDEGEQTSAGVGYWG